ncbi:MAG TPA: hypothetical protein PL106_16095, partial [Flavobacteriales bacterium]|nr:hypothetical protein [Flavobacteriales bacterium]
MERTVIRNMDEHGRMPARKSGLMRTRVHGHIAILLAFALSSCAFKNKDADLVIHNARIISLDPEGHEYQAMAIKDGRIVELGPERLILNGYSAKESYDAVDVAMTEQLIA